MTACKHKWIPLGKEERLGSMSIFGITRGSKCDVYFYCENCLSIEKRTIEL